MENGSYNTNQVNANASDVPRNWLGKVLISGDSIWHSDGSASTEIYDYTNNTITKGPAMNCPRGRHAAVALSNGNVVLFGGKNDDLVPSQLSSCEVLDVKSGVFCHVGHMSNNREKLAAVQLQNGIVLLVGGYDGSRCLNTCEFFNPETNGFSASAAKMKVGRCGHTASLLASGKVLVAGGFSASTMKNLNTSEIYDPENDSFSDGPVMTSKRSGHTATNLPNGTTLLCGGHDKELLDTTEMYHPADNCFYPSGSLFAPRSSHFAACLPNGLVLLGGGSTKQIAQTMELVNPVTFDTYQTTTLLTNRVGSTASFF